jgi:threonine dehydrogenase-like Zn-dependent dehydrogenase
MLALTWDGTRSRVVADAPVPEACDPTSAVVRVRLAGICSTDLQIIAGYMGFRGVLGHEFVGEVTAGPEAWVGRRVVGEINFACGRCPTCLAGRRRHCPSRSVMGILAADGAFAEYVRLPIENLHHVPDGLRDEEAVFVEPLAAAVEASLQTAAFAGGRTIVLGAGKLGLLVGQVMAARGDDVTVACRDRAACVQVEARVGLCAAAVEDVRRGCDLVIEATGTAEGLSLAMDLVRPLGGIVLKSTIAERHALDLAPLVINEVTLIGSRCGPFGPALASLVEHGVRVTPLIDAVLPLRDGAEALRRAAVRGTKKILLQPGA